MLTHVDLFSGIGGFALAAKWAAKKFLENPSIKNKNDAASAAFASFAAAHAAHIANAHAIANAAANAAVDMKIKIINHGLLILD